MPLSRLSSGPAASATTFQCPQCRASATLSLIQPALSCPGAEWRTFECNECGLPRTYPVETEINRTTREGLAA